MSLLAVAAWTLAGLILPYLAAAPYLLSETLAAVRFTDSHMGYRLAAKGFGCGTLTGMLLGLLVAARSKSLGAWVLGPTLGIAGGFLDLAVFGRLVRGGWMIPAEAVLLPVWSLLGAAAIHHACPSAWTVLRRVTAAGAVDFASRASWLTLSGWFQTPQGTGQLYWHMYLEPLVYVPTTCLLLYFAGRSRTERHASLGESQGTPVHVPHAKSPYATGAGGAAILTLWCACALAIWAPPAAQGPELDSDQSPLDGIPLSGRLPPLSPEDAAGAIASVLDDRGLTPQAWTGRSDGGGLCPCRTATKVDSGGPQPLNFLIMGGHLEYDPRSPSPWWPLPRSGHLLIVRVRDYGCFRDPLNVGKSLYRVFDPARAHVGTLEFRRFKDQAREPALLRVHRAAERFIDAVGATGPK